MSYNHWADKDQLEYLKKRLELMKLKQAWIYEQIKIVEEELKAYDYSTWDMIKDFFVSLFLRK